MISSSLPVWGEWIGVFLTPAVLGLSFIVAIFVYRHHRRTGNLESILKVIKEYFHGDHSKHFKELYELCESGKDYGIWTDGEKETATAIMADLNTVGHLVKEGLIEERFILPEYSDVVCKSWISIQPHRKAHPSPEPFKWPGFKWLARKAYESRGCPKGEQLADWFRERPKGYEGWNLESLFPRE